MKLPHFSVVGVIFTWVLLTLTLYRLTHLVTKDGITRGPRDRFIAKHPNTLRAELIHCDWCVSVWLGGIGYFFACHMLNLPLPALQAVSSMAVCGFIGNFTD